MSAQADAAAGVQQKPSLTLKRRVKAPPEKVFRAWTEPQKIAAWWGVIGTQRVESEVELKVGGRFHIVMHQSDGRTHDVSGVYRLIEPNRKLVFTWAWRSTPERESLVTIDCRPDGDGTILTLTHEQFLDAAARDDHAKGWTELLDIFERYCAKA